MTSENVFFFPLKMRMKEKGQEYPGEREAETVGAPEGPTRSFASDEPEITVVNLQEEV